MSIKRQLIDRMLPASYRERAEQALRLYEANKAEVDAAVATLVDRITLIDGRVLVAAERRPHRVFYRCLDGMRVMASVDATPHGLLRHVSVSYQRKDPRWSDLRVLREAFFAPDVDVIQVLPRAGEYINLHAHTFHLFEAPEAWQGGLFV